MRSPRSHRRCPVCGEALAEVVYAQHFAIEEDGHRVSGYDVVVCEPCGAVYADGIPAQDALDEYYRASSKYEYLEDRGEPPEWLTRWHSELAASLLPFLQSPDARIVDIGCGNGDVLGLLKALGYEQVLGVDPADASADAARRLHGVEVLKGGISALPKAARGADCVILSAVLEHLRDVRPALEAAAGILAPEGMLYIEVPDLEHFSDQVVPPFQQFSVEHINFFTATAVENAGAPVGLRVIDTWRAVRRIGPSEEPSLCMVLRSSPPHQRSTERDLTGESAVRRYVSLCASCEKAVASRIEDLVKAETAVIIWGAGTHALHLLESTSLRRANVVAIVDANPRLHGVLVAGRPVAAPESVASRPEPLLICSPLHQDEIVRMARERFAMSNEIVTLYGPPGPADACVADMRRAGEQS